VCGQGWPWADPRLCHRLLDGVSRREDHHRPDPEAKGQQVAQGDRPIRGQGIIERAVDGAQHSAVRQLRQPPIDRLVETQHAFLHQNHRRCGHDRFGHRGDAEDGVAPHRVAAAERLGADRVDLNLAPPAEERDHAGHNAAAYVAGHHVAHAPEPRLRKFSVVHLIPKALDEILSTSVLPFRKSLPNLIYHHARRAVLLQPAE
jgi:hypothetical protein